MSVRRALRLHRIDGFHLFWKKREGERKRKKLFHWHANEEAWKVQKLQRAQVLT